MSGRWPLANVFLPDWHIPQVFYDILVFITDALQRLLYTQLSAKLFVLFLLVTKEGSYFHKLACVFEIRGPNDEW